MTRRILLTLATAVILLGPGIARADDVGEGYNPNWTLCRSDEDCVEIKLPCAKGAVNKKFKSDAEEFYKNHAFQALSCVQPPDPHGFPVCDLNAPCDPATDACAKKYGQCKIISENQQ